MNYKLDTERAKNAGKGGYITTSGKYEGIFTEAKTVTAKTGTKGIEFSFEDFDGQVANFMTIYTQKADGSSIYGEDMIHAMMACMKLRELPEAKGRFTAAEGKPIGLVLQREEYEKKDRSIGFKMNILHFYQVGTNKMADEILNKTEAERLDKITISDKTLREAPTSSASERNDQPHEGGGDDFEDDDIPF